MAAPADDIRRIALQNAAAHGGRTRDGIVLAKLLGARPEYRGQAKEIMGEIADMVAEINGMSAEQQGAALAEYQDAAKPGPGDAAGDAPTDAGYSTGQALPPLEGAQDGGVVTRFPPEPSGYPHIGHAKAAIINEWYVDRYGGKKILRMDDTNPEGERLEYYAAIKVGLEWLGIRYDVIKNTSDDMGLLYAKGAEMIRTNHAYVCTCKRDEISRNRQRKAPCRCSRAEPGKNHDMWERMFEKYKPGEAVARYRGDMGSENTVMRDPIIFRIIDARHPLTLDRYRVWPGYDFAVAIEDSSDGVTHAFRTKEYELRDQLYCSILDDLGMRKPVLLEFARLEFEGMPVSKRILRPLIEEQKVAWYDDPRLPTLEAMRRRGIRPEAIRRFILSLGFTKSNTLAPFGALEAFNRKAVDATSIRLHMARRPTELAVGGMPASPVRLANHPSADLGSRMLATDDTVLISGDDAERLAPGDCIRLMGLGNVRITSEGRLAGEYSGDEMKGYPIVQWVPRRVAHKINLIITNRLFVDGKFNEDSLVVEEVAVEPHYLELADDTEIQFVRFGYCRKESGYRAIMTHR